MKKRLLLFVVVSFVRPLHAEAGSLERGAAAWTLLQGLPEVLLLDVPEVERDLKKRQGNLSVLKGVITKQKSAVKMVPSVGADGEPLVDKQGNQKQKAVVPVTDSMITSYLAIAEFKDIVDIFIYIVDDIFQKKLILPMATVLGQSVHDKNYIGKYFNKVKDVLKNVSAQLKDFLAIQRMIVGLMDTETEKLAIQRKLLTDPIG
jgi:hypothetical protein